MSKYKHYYTVYKDKDWEMLPQIHQGVINSWHILKRFLTEEEIVVTPMDGIHCHPSLKSKISSSTTPKRRRQARKKPQSLLPESRKPTNLPKRGRRTRKIIGGNHIP
ncbi:hypothetical protein O181_088264 [Austropuccinia psidii MF-1]|uniref:Uncharacterized protein n=1 Tax=Austropuccinia psidii MF-1 TaxID=1389203 RepID=A0A9Q3IRA2_9BASI|nr:hypothetical protein [Austropuccinia psidii MF-1]